MPWYKYTFGSNNALPSGATVDVTDWKMYMSYGYSYSNNQITANSTKTEIELQINVLPTASCSGAITPYYLV